MGSGAEGFSEVAGECADVGAFAAGHADGSAWQSESGVVGHIDSAGCGVSVDFRFAFAHPTTAWSPRFRAAGGTVLAVRSPLSYSFARASTNVAVSVAISVVGCERQQFEFRDVDAGDAEEAFSGCVKI